MAQNLVIKERLEPFLLSQLDGRVGDGLKEDDRKKIEQIKDFCERNSLQ
jgi:hypothetical protein